jgi:dTDP-4-dehydrorhamnose 3,5-epimerase
VIRGLHWQTGEFAQSKLVRVAKGSVYDVAVDIRVGSPTFGKYVIVALNEFNHRQLFIPRGFAHGFITIKDDTVFQYKCDNFYNKESECAIRWNDPDINIDWKSYVNLNQVILSDKDKQNKFLKDLTINNLFDYNKNYYK